jgi:hypothetical protein
MYIDPAPGAKSPPPAVKRNRFIRLSGGIETVNRVLEVKARTWRA